MEEDKEEPNKPIEPKTNSVQDTIQKRKQKVIDWFKKDKLNIYLVAVLVFAVAIRLYYFIQVGDQPLWWDEACYGSLAKNLISGKWAGTQLIVGETQIRPMLFPIVWAALLFLKLPESAIRFILEFIPSTLAVFFVYLIGKETFNKRVGIISALIFSVLWIHLFYGLRFLTNIPALAILFASIYLFLVSIRKDIDYKYFFLSLFVLSIAVIVRYTSGMFFFLFLFMLFLEKKVYLKNKKFWISGILGISPVLLFFIINYFLYGNIFPALLSGNYINTSNQLANPIAFHLLSFIPNFLQHFFFLFLLGFSVILFELVLGYNLILKSKNLRKPLFLLLYLVLFYSFFVFYMRFGEDRWFLESSLALVCFAGYGIDLIFKFIRKYSKEVAFLVILAILFIGAYQQVTFSNSLITNKQTSFLEIRQGFEWVKSNTPENAVIYGSGIEPYAAYYAERYFEVLPTNLSDLHINKDEYLFIHAFTPQPEYLTDYISQNEKRLQLENIFYFDAQKQQPAVVIYRFKE